MRIIFSRKGFDSSIGGCASPIFEDGSFVSLPIPDPKAPLTFADIEPNIGVVVEDLSRNRIRASERAHLDPDVRHNAVRRVAGWHPMFGQCAQAQRHLEANDVGVGDVFLFFGWFRRVERRDGKYQYQPNAPDLHMLFGWLEIGQVLNPGTDTVPEWGRRHPHAVHDFGDANRIYLAAEAGRGAGVFKRFDHRLVLTSPLPNKKRSIWRLPRWFSPKEGRKPLSYHRLPTRWTSDAIGSVLRTVGRGQEFVLDAEHYPEAEPWLDDLLEWNRRG